MNTTLADARNIGSYRVNGKIWNATGRVIRQRSFPKGEWVDDVWDGLLRSEWEAIETTG